MSSRTNSKHLTAFDLVCWAAWLGQSVPSHGCLTPLAIWLGAVLVAAFSIAAWMDQQARRFYLWRAIRLMPLYFAIAASGPHVAGCILFGGALACAMFLEEP